MNPAELIYFMLLAGVCFIVLLVIWFIFRKRKKVAIVLTCVVVISYIGYYLYFPTLKEQEHAKKYEQVQTYLAATYPEQLFTVQSKKYEPGVIVGDFDVNRVETPHIGVTLRVGDDGSVSQVSTWEDMDYPSQQELWREIEHRQILTGNTVAELEGAMLDKEKMIEVLLRDQWIDGELTVFAVTINDLPAVAVYNYSNEGYSLIQLQQGETNFAVAEHAGQLFVYVDETYVADTIAVKLENGGEQVVDLTHNKGQLLVIPIEV